jgi:hypothetical protein
MNLEHKVGLEMQLPNGKIPGFYAQIVKGIAQHASLFDRYKELLIFNSNQDLSEVIKLLEHYRVPSERYELLFLPSEGLEQGHLFADYAIITRNENNFIDLALTAVFTLNTSKPDAEPAPALMQLEEHLIGKIVKDSITIHLLDRQLTELAERVAFAYGCQVNWLY